MLLTESWVGSDFVYCGIPFFFLYKRKFHEIVCEQKQLNWSAKDGCTNLRLLVSFCFNRIPTGTFVFIYFQTVTPVENFITEARMFPPEQSSKETYLKRKKKIFFLNVYHFI